MKTAPTNQPNLSQGHPSSSLFHPPDSLFAFASYRESKYARRTEERISSLRGCPKTLISIQLGSLDLSLTRQRSQPQKVSRGEWRFRHSEQGILIENHVELP